MEFEFGFGFIRGMMLGIEFPSAEDTGEPNLIGGMVVDLLIIRIAVMFWKEQ